MGANQLFWIFLLTHLLGDYVFQTSYIAINKSKSLKVLILHIFIIFLCMFLLLIPHSLKIWNFLIIITITAIHFLLDSIKIKFKGNSVSAYLADQLMHLIVLAIFSRFFYIDNFFINQKLVIMLSLAIINAYFLDIFAYFIFDGNGIYKKDVISYIMRASLPFFGYFWSMIYLFAGFLMFFYFLINYKRYNKKKDFLAFIMGFLLTILIFEG